MEKTRPKNVRVDRTGDVEFVEVKVKVPGEQLSSEELRHEVRQILPSLLQRVEYEEGDTFLVRTSGHWTEKKARIIEDWWKMRLPGTKCIVLEEGTEVQLVGKAVSVAVGERT